MAIHCTAIERKVRQMKTGVSKSDRIGTKSLSELAILSSISTCRRVPRKLVKVCQDAMNYPCSKKGFMGATYMTAPRVVALCSSPSVCILHSRSCIKDLLHFLTDSSIAKIMIAYCNAIYSVALPMRVVSYRAVFGRGSCSSLP